MWETLQVATHVHAGNAWLVTGGLGGLGTLIACWGRKRGAAWTWLVGRNGHTTAGKARLAAPGWATAVCILQADVACAESNRWALQRREAIGTPPLRCAVHAAGELQACLPRLVSITLVL